MELNFTLLDAVALLAFSLALATGIRLGAPFTLAVIPAILLYVMLASFLPNISLVLPILALIIGFAMTMATQFIPLPRLTDHLEAIVGGAGGFVWDVLLALTIWVSFPSEFKSSSGTWVYPSSKLPSWIQTNIARSDFAQNSFNLASSNTILRAALLPHMKR